MRSFVCAAGHELRITERCLTADLNEQATAHFIELAGRHEIVKAFRRERRSTTIGVDTLGPAGGAKPLTVLRHRHTWRGVTWFDEEVGVVWLCACARHRSGQLDDAFPWFESLRDAGHIWPRDNDYESLAADRGEQFAAFVVDEAPQLLSAARAEPDKEHSWFIGREPVAMVVQIVDTLEETFVAVSGVNLLPDLFQLLLVALYPDRGFDEWRPAQQLPTRPLDYTRSEFCLSIVHG